MPRRRANPPSSRPLTTLPGMATRALPVRLATAVTAISALMSGATGCRGGADSAAEPSGTMVVFAAASLTEAFTAVGAAFEAERPGTTVTFSFAASSELAAQIVEGAPADVFASADWNNMVRLTDADATQGEPVVFATNRSEIVVAPGNPLGIESVADLVDDDLVLVVCAPEVPCGTYASMIFEQAGVAPTPDSYESNVKSVVTKVALGEADAGIAYATDVLAADGTVGGVEIASDIDVVAEYPIAVTAETSDPDLAQGFVDFVLGDDGRALLAEHGFSAP